MTASSFRLPTPPTMRNHGYRVASICDCNAVRCSSSFFCVALSERDEAASRLAWAAPASLLSNSALARAISKASAMSFSAVWRLA